MPDSIEPAAVEADPVRYSADKLAILCVERPALYVVNRVWATATVVLLLSFLLDALALLFAWIASIPWLLYLLSDELMSEVDRAALRAGAPGLPMDAIRLAALVFAFAALITTQLLSTRGLPSGSAAMRATVIHGLPWPGRWSDRARVARRARPWAIGVIGLICCAVLFATLGWPATVSDYFYSVIIVGFVFGMVWLFAYLGRVVGLVLTNHLPSHVDLTSEDLAHAERAVADADADDALRLWPKYPALRLKAANDVFNAPPPPSRRSERARHAWWTDTETSVEALATELILVALMEGQSRGLIALTDLHRRNPRVVGVTPQRQQPTGLAALIAGRHREGQQEGTVVAGKLSYVLDAVADADQYARVIGLALEDLAACDMATREDGVWKLKRHRLAEVRIEATGDTTSPFRMLSEQQTVRLRRTIARRLRHKRTTDADSSLNPLKILYSIYTVIGERDARSAYQLPQDADGPAHQQE